MEQEEKHELEREEGKTRKEMDKEEKYQMGGKE